MKGVAQTKIKEVAKIDDFKLKKNFVRHGLYNNVSVLWGLTLTARGSTFQIWRL